MENKGQRRQAWVAIAMGSIAIALLWRLLPSASQPLYDGLCPAGPYRLLGGDPPPSSASQVYPGSQFPTAEVLTNEAPPQAQILMMAGTFSATSSVTVSITPVSPPAPPPEGRLQDGNAYKITAAVEGRDVQPNSGDPATIVLRGSGDTGSLVMYSNTVNGWQPLKTFNLGCGFTFEAVSPKLGYFALFRIAGSAGGGPSRGGVPVAVIVAVLGGLIVVATLVLARLAATRRR